ncbi:ADP-ribosylation factor-like protein 11 [Ambystoma mexicanum]|uniref:ADP-ribosylation factor-like protein 11 n=1 Tax=Ambystoma mexicanum TaxID=8296 RepID=UPI0037E91E5E
MGAPNSKAQYKRQAKVVMMGLDFAGKSTLLYKLKRNQTVETFPTVGFNVESLETDSHVSLTIWDVGGQDKLRPNWKEYLEDTDALIFVIDSSDEARLENATTELLAVLNNDFMAGVPFLVLANKQDVPSALTIDELVAKLKLEDYNDRPWEIKGCSASTGEGVAETLNTVGKLIKQRKHL